MSEMAAMTPDSAEEGFPSDDALRREQYFFTLYRALVAALYALLVFGPLTGDWVMLRNPVLAGWVAALYLPCSLVLMLYARRLEKPLFWQVSAGVMLDVLATVLMVHAVMQLQTGIAMSLFVTFGAAAVLLPFRACLVLALLAGGLLLGEYMVSRMAPGFDPRSLIEIIVCVMGYLAMTKLGSLVGRQMREAHVLVQQRGAEVENLAQINELVIRRMRTGVLVVDVAGIVHLHNEAAWHLLGQPGGDRLVLGEVALELAQRLYQWRMGDGRNDGKPIHLGADLPDVIPRFAGLGTNNELFVIFLDDTSMVSRRAEELTLTNLGRLSAGIAHEIRNPLAAISYSAQLLDESPDLSEADRRLVDIVLNHCLRMNGIIENVLNLSRRERSRPESIDAAEWVLQFVEEYKRNHYLDATELRAFAQEKPLNVMIDPQQLDQVVSCLVQNAIQHGHKPNEPARISISARRLQDTGCTVIEVVDRGPGIPPKVAETIFEPFVTTHETGNGLGLYIARQLCEANQARLDFVPMAGGSCFRISLAHAQRLENLPGVRQSKIAL